jgi:tRNA 2-thiouridine synthesizing protein E
MEPLMRTKPDIISTEHFATGDVHRDEHGYLIDPAEWSPEVAEAIAAEEGIRLCPEHWQVIDFMRDYFEQHGIAADARFVYAHLGRRSAADAGEGRRRFFLMFPYGYVKQACKIAGMRQPRAWSTG